MVLLAAINSMKLSRVCHIQAKIKSDWIGRRCGVRFTWWMYSLNKNTSGVTSSSSELTSFSSFSLLSCLTVYDVTFHTPAWVSLTLLMRNEHVFLSMHSMSPLIWWYSGTYSNSSPRLVSRVHLNAFPTDSAFSVAVEPGVEVTIFSASISFRCIPISTSPAAVRDEIHSSTPLVDHRGRKPGTVSAETDPISFFARRGKTRRSINSETNERWDAGFCTGWTAPRAGMGRPHERVGARMKEKRDGVTEGGCGPTGKGWNRGRTINLTIYPLRRGRGARSEEEVRKRWSASCCPNKRRL